MGHKASTICLHLNLSCAACCASPQVRFISFSSAVTVRRQVILGWPCFLFPGWVHRRVILGMRSWSILRTCPSHLNRRRLISSTTLLHFVFLYDVHWIFSLARRFDSFLVLLVNKECCQTEPWYCQISGALGGNPRVTAVELFQHPCPKNS